MPCLNTRAQKLFTLASLILAIRATPRLDDEIFYSSAVDASSPYNLINIDGDLSNIFEEPFRLEMLASGFGFSEGVQWIPDSSYYNNGYILFLEQADCIWKFWWELDSDDNSISTQLECINSDYNYLLPAALGHNANFPNELWIAFFGNNSIARLDLNRFELLNYWNVDKNDNILYGADDIAIDSFGNVYFSTLPLFLTEGVNISGAVYKISRYQDPQGEVDYLFDLNIVEYINWGPNGMALSKDEKLLVAANTIDFPIGTFNWLDNNQIDLNNLFYRGYYLDRNCGDFLSDGFMFYETTDDSELINVFNGVHDSNEFDFRGNYYQGMVYVPTGGGTLIVIENNWLDVDQESDSNESSDSGRGSGRDGGTGSSSSRSSRSSSRSSRRGGRDSSGDSVDDRDSRIIGLLEFGNDFAPMSFEVVSDGYMYVVGGNFFTDNGFLARIKLNE